MKALVLRSSDARSNYRQILEEATCQHMFALRDVVYLGEESWDRLIAGGKDPGPGPTDPHSVVNIQYTSGTTGFPKGVLLSHRNLINNGGVIIHGLRLSRQGPICVPGAFSLFFRLRA